MVQDLLREREQLKSQLAGQVSTPHVVGFSLSRFDVNLEPAENGEFETHQGMETLIDRADTALRSSWASASEQVVARCDAMHGMVSVESGLATQVDPTMTAGENQIRMTETCPQTIQSWPQFHVRPVV